MNEPADRRSRRFDEILDAAAELVRTKSIESTTFAEIAGRLGIRQQALYYYVPSRDHLFFHLLEREMDRSLETLRAAGEGLAGAALVRRLFRTHVGTIAERPALFQFFYGQLESLDEELQAPLRRRERAYTTLFRSAVADAIAAGELPAVDPRIAAETLLGMATWSYQWMRPSDHQRIDTIVDQMLSLVAFGSEEHP